MNILINKNERTRKLIINLLILGVWILSIVVASLCSFGEGYMKGKEYMAKNVKIGDSFMCNYCGYKATFEAKE